ncbi:hypothetical protein [Kitasatospora paranensis]|uniref:DUF1963 domain-containing protein n=1 Tax=Kitasatospora paranensis TaxID=258053 RepID=A0ABW2G0R5_9ACTN
MSAILRRIPYEEEIAQNGPLPMLPVAQLYAADVPLLPRPDGADLFQFLWCPFTDHAEGYAPRIVLRWRTAADIRDPLAAAPQPSVIGSPGNLLPDPCVLHPETVTEYPNSFELPRDLRERIDAWESRHGVDYHGELSVAPGCKVGGHVHWEVIGPVSIVCAECGSDVRPLLTIDSYDWDGEAPSWRPIEEFDAELPDDITPAWSTKLYISRGYSLQLYTCETSWDHPHVQKVQ